MTVSNTAIMANDRWGCGNPSAWMVFDIFMWGNIPKTKRAVARGGARSGQTGQNATRYRGCRHGYMVDFINQYKMWLILSTCFRDCS